MARTKTKSMRTIMMIIMMKMPIMTTSGDNRQH